MSYAVEATAGTRPTTGYTALSNIKSIPENNPTPETLDTTVLSETVQRTSVPGLKGNADTMTLVANLTNETITSWSGYVTAASALTGGKQTWLCIKVPGLTNCAYVRGMPVAMGSPAVEVNSVLETNLYFVPAGAAEFAAAPSSGGTT